MDRFVIRKRRGPATEVDITVATDGGSRDRCVQDSCEGEASETAAAKRARLSTQGSSSQTAKMRLYKSSLKYNPEWKAKWRWMEYDEHEDGMFCTFCKKYGKPPVVARGAWTSRPVHNWVKATELLKKHEQSDWHLASVEAQALAESAKRKGDIVERMLAATEAERRKNRELIKMLTRSLYFLVKHRMPHTTTFEDLIMLQIDNGSEQLETHKRTCPSNATYVSKATTTELLSSISHCIEEGLLTHLKSSQFISIMADESTDISSKEELSVCGRWLESGKPVEHFLGIIHAQEVNAEALTRYLLRFLHEKGIPIQKLRGLGFDGTNTMSGNKSGVQIRMRRHAPSALFVHCRCHQLQLAAVHAANEHREVQRVLGTLLTIWKTFHYSPKKLKSLWRFRQYLMHPR